jgi:hypothetical protein
VLSAFYFNEKIPANYHKQDHLPGLNKFPGLSRRGSCGQSIQIHATGQLRSIKFIAVETRKQKSSLSSDLPPAIGQMNIIPDIQKQKI